MNVPPKKELPESILYSASAGEIEPIDNYLAQGGDINAACRGDHLICNAAHHQRWDVVRYLIKKGADIHSRGRDGASLVSGLAVCDDESIAREFLELQVNPNMYGYYGVDALSNAVDKGNTGVVKALLEYGADVNTPNTRKKRLTPALLDATHNGDHEMVLILLKAGIDTRCAGNRWSLSCAVQAQDPKMVDVLIDNGFNIKFRKNDFISVNCVAGRLRHPLVEAALVNDIYSMKRMLKAGMKADHYHDWPAESALYVAARHGHYTLVELLIEYGASLTYDRAEKSQFKDFTLPIAAAILSESIEVINYMVESGADPEEPISGREHSFTGISLASSSGFEKVVKYFQERYGDGIIEKHRKMLRDE